MELVIMNIVMMSFIIYSLYQILFKRKQMTDSAYHHFLSHLFIVVIYLIAVNIFYYNGWMIPMLFALLYTIQHVSKENERLIKTGKWTDSVKDNIL